MNEVNMDSTLLLNGREVPFKPGQTILEVAEDNKVRVPTLCYLARTGPTAACRICVVELLDSDILVPACATPANAGMDVRTDSTRVTAARKEILRLLIARGHHDCPVCDQGGECTLQDLVHEYGVEHVPMSEPPRDLPPEYATSLIRYWPERCVLCYRCVSACRDYKHIRAIDILGTGNQGRVVAVNSDICEACGECLLACPTGALTENLSRFKYRTWLADRIPTTCPFCGCGCQMELNVHKNRVVGITSHEDVGSNQGSLCVAGRFGYEFIADADRLTRPLIRKNGTLQESTWEEALRFTADHLQFIRQDFGADSIGGLTSTTCTNEEGYLFQRLMRTALGTNNVDSAARDGHWIALAGLKDSLGLPGMTNPVHDLAKARTILVVASNTTAEHPVYANRLLEAVHQQEARLLVIGAEATRLSQMAEIWLQPKPGTEADLVKGLLLCILQENRIDQAALQTRTSGLEALKTSLVSFTPDAVASKTRVPEDRLRKAAAIFAQTTPAATLFGSEMHGISRKPDLVQALINLSLACNHPGSEGGGLYPLAAGGNAQGVCDQGVLPDFFPGYQDLSTNDIRQKFMNIWKVNRLPGTPGFTRTTMFDRAQAGKLRGMYLLGDNPLDGDLNPNLDQGAVEQALRKLSFLVVQDIFLTETALMADVILPGACFAEKDGTLTSSERLIQRMRKGLNPPGDARDDLRILMDLARSLGVAMNFPSAGAVMDEIAGINPLMAGIAYPRIARQGIAWPCSDRRHPGTPRLYTQGLPHEKAAFI